MAVGPQDDPVAIQQALDALQADVPFFVRNYAHYEGAGQLADEKKAVRHIDLLHSLQPTEEPNLHHLPGDGSGMLPMLL